MNFLLLIFNLLFGTPPRNGLRAVPVSVSARRRGGGRRSTTGVAWFWIPIVGWLMIRTPPWVRGRELQSGRSTAKVRPRRDRDVRIHDRAQAERREDD